MIQVPRTILRLVTMMIDEVEESCERGNIALI
jgi:hypothetical protein